MAGLQVTAFLFRFEIEDMALYNVGIPLDFDLLAVDIQVYGNNFLKN